MQCCTVCNFNVSIAIEACSLRQSTIGKEKRSEGLQCKNSKPANQDKCQMEEKEDDIRKKYVEHQEA